MSILSPFLTQLEGAGRTFGYGSRDIGILRELIRDTARVSIEESPDRKGKKQVRLSESQCEKCGTVTITGLPEETVVIKADQFPAPRKIFTCSQGECRRADFIIAADTGKEQFVLFIEMKAGSKSSGKDVVEQLRGAQCLVGYCKEIAAAFRQAPDFLKDYRYRFVTIGHISNAKRRTRYPSRKTLTTRRKG